MFHHKLFNLNTRQTHTQEELYSGATENEEEKLKLARKKRGTSSEMSTMCIFRLVRHAKLLEFSIQVKRESERGRT